MAEKVARPRVELNSKQVTAQLEQIELKAKDLKKQLKQAFKLKQTDILPGIKRELRKTETEIKGLKRELVSVDMVLKNLNGSSMENLKKALSQQSRVVNKLTRDHKNYQKEVGKLKAIKGAMKSMNGDIMQQEGFLRRAANGFNNYFAAITAGFAAVAGVIMVTRKAIDKANIREEGIDDLQALTGLGDEVVNKLAATAAKTSTTVDESGVRIKQGADDIIQAYKLVGSQRAELLKNSDALHEVTKDAIILSEAAKGELEPAAKALTNTLNQFQLSADESRRVINALAAGSQAGAADIPYLSQAIEKSGTTAMLMGVQMETAIGAIETISPYYSEASLAGNSFDKVLLQLKKDQIGYTSGAFDLNDAINELREKFNSGTTAVDVFGVRHAKLAELLVLNQDKLKTFTNAVTGSNKAVEQATINTSNNAASLAQAKNRTAEYAVILGQKLAPAMKFVVSSGTLTLKMISGLIDIFSKYGKSMLIAAALIAAYTLAVKAEIVVDKLKVFWTNKLSSSVTKLFNTLKSNPWTVITGLILLAVIAIQKFANKTKIASAEQREFNKLLKEGQELLNNTKPIKDRAAIMHTLSKGQLITLKNEIADKLKEEEEYNSKLLSLLQIRFNDDAQLKRLYKRMSDDEYSAIQKAGIANQIKLRKQEIAQDLQLEADKHNANKRLLKGYLKDVEKTIRDFKEVEEEVDEEKEGLEEDLQKALLALRKKYGLVSQYELYQIELKELKKHLNDKLLNEAEFMQARQFLYNKYLKTDPIEDEPGEIKSDELPVEMLRENAESNYQDELYAQSLDYQYELLQLQWEKGEVGWTEYYYRLGQLDQSRIDNLKMQLVEGMQHAAGLMHSINSILSSGLEKQKQQELDAAGDNAAKKEEIETKYRKKQQKLALKAAYIDIALAEIKAFASAPVPLNIPAVLAATLQGVATIEAIKAQEFYYGGYTSTGTSTDAAGIVHKNEFVANAQATANPKVKGVLDIINLAQQNGSINTLDLPAAIRSMNITRGFYKGGYESDSTAPAAIPDSSNGQSLQDAAMLIYKAAQIFASKDLIITQEAIKKIHEAGYEYEVLKTTGKRA